MHIRRNYSCSHIYSLNPADYLLLLFSSSLSASATAVLLPGQGLASTYPPPHFRLAKMVHTYSCPFERWAWGPRRLVGNSWLGLSSSWLQNKKQPVKDNARKRISQKEKIEDSLQRQSAFGGGREDRRLLCTCTCTYDDDDSEIEGKG